MAIKCVQEIHRSLFPPLLAFKIPKILVSQEKEHKFLLLAEMCLQSRIRRRRRRREGKVSIEKYYKEIGSLSSCFCNGFKWFYLSLKRTLRRERLIAQNLIS